MTCGALHLFSFLRGKVRVLAVEPDVYALGRSDDLSVNMQISFP